MRSLRLIKYRYYFRNLKEFLTLYKDIFIFCEYDFTSAHNRPFIIDCGSHIGVSTLFFKHKFPESKILCFEPNIQNYKILRKNIEVNKLSGVTMINAAVSNKKGVVKFYVPENKEKSWSWGGSLIKGKDSRISFSVSSVLLSSYINKTVDLLKIDIEGAEASVIKEVGSKLRKVKEIYIEFHAFKGLTRISADTIYNLLEKYGFRFTIKQGKDPDYAIIHAKNINN